MSKQNYWGQALEGANEESTGGVISKARIDLGYFAFVSGFTGDDRDKCVFIPDKPTKAARAKALKQAQAFATSNGGEKRAVRWCVITRIYQDEAMKTNGDEVTWSNDRLETVPLWTLKGDSPSAAKAVMEAISTLNVPGGKDFYGRFGWPPDPFKQAQGDAGKTDEDQEGNARYPTVCLVLEVYPNREAAAEAVGTPADTDSDMPDWAGADWTSLADLEATYHAFVEKRDDYDTLEELVKGEAGDETVEWAINLLSDVGEMSVKQIAKFTGMTKGQVKAAL